MVDWILCVWETRDSGRSLSKNECLGVTTLWTWVKDNNNYAFPPWVWRSEWLFFIRLATEWRTATTSWSEGRTQSYAHVFLRVFSLSCALGLAYPNFWPDPSLKGPLAIVQSNSNQFVVRLEFVCAPSSSHIQCVRSRKQIRKFITAKLFSLKLFKIFRSSLSAFKIELLPFTWLRVFKCRSLSRCDHPSESVFLRFSSSCPHRLFAILILLRLSVIGDFSYHILSINKRKSTWWVICHLHSLHCSSPYTPLSTIYRPHQAKHAIWPTAAHFLCAYQRNHRLPSSWRNWFQLQNLKVFESQRLKSSSRTWHYLPAGFLSGQHTHTLMATLCQAWWLTC